MFNHTVLINSLTSWFHLLLSVDGLPSRASEWQKRIAAAKPKDVKSPLPEDWNQAIAATIRCGWPVRGGFLEAGGWNEGLVHPGHLRLAIRGAMLREVQKHQQTSMEYSCLAQICKSLFVIRHFFGQIETPIKRAMEVPYRQKSIRLL